MMFACLWGISSPLPGGETNAAHFFNHCLPSPHAQVPANWGNSTPSSLWTCRTSPKCPGRRSSCCGSVTPGGGVAGKVPGGRGEWAACVPHASFLRMVLCRAFVPAWAFHRMPFANAINAFQVCPQTRKRVAYIGSGGFFIPLHW